MQSAAVSQYNCTQTITLGWMTEGNKHDVVVFAYLFQLFPHNMKQFIEVIKCMED